MALEIKKVEVWAGDIADQPGGLAGTLGAIAEAGGNLECVIARRQPDKPGTGVVFVTPVKGKKVQAAARGAGLIPAADIATLRISGPDKPGIGRALAQAAGDAGINIRGVSAMVLGRQFIAYFAFDSVADADQAAKAFKALDRKPARR